MPSKSAKVNEIKLCFAGNFCNLQMQTNIAQSLCRLQRKVTCNKIRQQSACRIYASMQSTDVIQESVAAAARLLF